MKKKLRIGALISGGGTNLQAILDACQTGAIHGNVVFVGSDQPKAAGLVRAAAQNIPTFVVEYGEIIARYYRKPEDVKLPSDFDFLDVWGKQRFFRDSQAGEKETAFLHSRVAAEALMLEKMQPYPFDLLVLAGFMRILTPYFVDRVNRHFPMPRIMNIHPALLPAFPGSDGYGDTFRYGCKVAGSTVHFVDYGEDTGPIIGQCAFSIDPDDTLERVKEKGLALEWKLYSRCVRLFSEDRLRLIRVSGTAKDGAVPHRTVVRIAARKKP